MKFWLVGKVNLEKNYKEWEFQGMFTIEAKAVAACADESYFVGPVVLNEALPHESVSWPDAYYPLARKD